MRIKIKRTTVDKLKAEKLVDEDGNVVDWITDKEIRGLAVRRLPSGSAQYWFRYQINGGKRQSVPLGIDGDGGFTPEQAIAKANDLRAQLRLGKDPRVEAEKAEAAKAAAEIKRTQGSCALVAIAFMKQFARKKRINWRETWRIFKKYVPREYRRRPIDEITRLDVARLLDRVEANNGEVMADRVLAAIRKLFNWHAARDNTFNSPIVKGMSWSDPKERARDRFLKDPEIRALWAATETTEPAAFGALIRMALLTAQRKSKVARMRWSDIEGDTWTITVERREKKHAVVVPLSDAARAVLASIKHRRGFVFSSDDGRRAFGGFSKAKRALDKKMLAELRKADRKSSLPHWTIHDLRRTARTLMAAAEVPRDIAERTLGHVIAGVEGVYDRHDYGPQKRKALDALAQRVAIILEGKPAKILDIRRGRDAREAATA